MIDIMAQFASFVVYVFFLLASTISSLKFGYAAPSVNEGSLIQIGAVLDTNSTLGSMLDLCIRMAVSDYYLANPNCTTRLKIRIKNAATLLDTNLAILDFLNNGDILGILGPHDETENKFITELGEKFLVPIVSFTARSSVVSQTRKGYFVRATPDDAFQAKALAAICRAFEWPDVVVLYEDTDYGNQFHTHLGKAFEEVEIGLDHINPIPTIAEDSYLLKELEKLIKKQTKVFLVHMRPSLGNRLFTLAKRIGIMSEGYVWIMSDSVSNFMDSMDQDTRNSMEGVLGVRPYIYHSKELKSFRQRWKRNMFLEKDKDSMMEPNIYGLWAYDAITALAISMEKIGPVNSTSFDVATSSKRDVKNLRASVGPRVLDELSRTRFRGLTGDFQLVDGKLKQSTFEIFNVFGSGEKTLGFWTPDEGIVKHLSSSGKRNYSTSIKELKNVMWPGDSVTQPKGWAIPTTGNLRVGVPRKHGFTEFVNATIDPETNHTIANGFAIDIFLAALKALPFPVNYELHLYSDAKKRYSNYEEMLHNIPQNFDMVVADTTIRAARATYVEFSLPYAESGITLVVKNKKPFDMWIFTKPLRWDLWLAIFISCILMGIVLRIMEKQATRNNEDQINQAPELGNQVRNNEALLNLGAEVENRATRNNNNHVDPRHIRRFGMIHWSPIAVFAFPESNMVSNTWSFLVLVFWMFMGFILMQSYTANLSAILTLDQLEFAFSDKYYVGYLGGSFMKHFLTDKLHISPSRLRSYASAEGYHEAMCLGSKNGGIDAIFDEIPYMKILLNKYDSQYKMVGPTYRTGGFAFAFPVGSPLADHFSRAILNVTQGPEITAIEQQNFGPGYSSQDPLSSAISQGPSSLTLYEFAGLFLVVGLVTLFSLFCSSTRIGRKLTTLVERLIQRLRCSANTVEDQQFARPNEEINDHSTNSPLPRQAADAQVIVPEDSQLEMVDIHEISGGTTVSQDSGDRITSGGRESSSSEQAEDFASHS